MPRVAPNDSTLASTSSSGAASERSSSASTTKITSRIAGITRARSRVGGVAGVELDRGVAADQDVRADPVEVGAQRAHRVGGRRATPRSPSRVASTHDVAVDHLGRGGVEPVGGPAGR